MHNTHKHNTHTCYKCVHVCVFVSTCLSVYVTRVCVYSLTTCDCVLTVTECYKCSSSLVCFPCSVQCLRDFNNFNSFLCILSAIESAAVSRLEWSDKVNKVCDPRSK